MPAVCDDLRITDDEWSRFWEKVDASGDCWVWTAGTSSNRYGKIKVRGQTLLAHRRVWQMLVGPIPDGLTIDHLCRNTLCVNPDHLQPVTMRENLLRGASFVAKNAKKTHCLRGHALSGDNVKIWGRNARFCLTCHRQRTRDTRRRQRGGV